MAKEKVLIAVKTYPTMECAWFEWIKGYEGEPVYGPILRKNKIIEKKCDSTIDLFEKR